MVLNGEEDLKAMVATVCRRRGLKVNAGKTKVMVLNGEEGCVLDESGSDEAECRRKLASGRRVAGAIMSLVNARDLQL